MCVSRKVGWDRDDVWLAHCCHLDGAETKQWAQHGIGVAHCPSSNMRLASGICPVSPECTFTLAKVQHRHVSRQAFAKASWSHLTQVLHMGPMGPLQNRGCGQLMLLRPLPTGSTSFHPPILHAMSKLNNTCNQLLGSVLRHL